MAEIVRGKVEWNCSRNFPWSEWTDGRIWRVRKGKDFKSTVDRMRQRVYARATQKGLKVRTKKESEQSLVFQFYEE